VKLSDLLRPWLKEWYSDELWIEDIYIRGIRRNSPRAFAAIYDEGPSVRTFRAIRSKTRQHSSKGFVFNWTPVYKTLRPSDPEFLEILKNELDLMRTAETYEYR
jgi:hypothetical protein